MTVDAWSPDGRFIIYDEENASGKSGIWELPLTSERKPVAFLHSDFAIRSACLSPDGRWTAYVSNETGRDEIYVQSFPGPGGKWLISSAGGSEPSWRSDGRELFFLSAGHALMYVQMEADQQVLRPGIPRVLFPTQRARFYAVAPNGDRFLAAMIPEDSEASSIRVVMNWVEDLRH
jgi:Tol biopolymer transport system component